MLLAEQQYLNILKDTVKNGVWVFNERTNTKCLTTLNQQIKFDGYECPVLTTRKINWKGAINEMVAYMRAYNTKEQFHSLNVKTWDANIDNWDPNKLYAGIIYGASAEVVGIGYYHILEMLRNNPTDRGIIWNFWNPEYFDEGCLRPCMYSHQFSVLDGTLHLTSTQRSADLALGSAFNIIQCWFLLQVTARLTDLEIGTVTLNMVNCHIYENQLELVKEHIQREPTELRPVVYGLSRITEEFLLQDPYNPCDSLSITNYEPLPSIKYPFTV